MEPEKKSNGALVGLIIIIIILVIGGFYIWQSKAKNALEEKQNTATDITNVTQEDSAELDTLQQELDTTNIDVGANVIDSVQ